MIGGGTFGADVSAPAGALASGYSIIEKVVITHTGAGSTSFDGSLVLTPEPASVALLGAVMFGVSMMIRKKMHKA